MKPEELQNIVAEILGVDPARLSDDAGPGSIDSWDSLAHLTIVTAVEETYGIQFGMDEIRQIDSFGALKKALQAHVAT